MSMELHRGTIYILCWTVERLVYNYRRLFLFYFWIIDHPHAQMKFQIIQSKYKNSLLYRHQHRSMPRRNRDNEWSAMINAVFELPPRNESPIDLRALRREKGKELQGIANEDRVGPYAPMAMTFSDLPEWKAKVSVGGTVESEFPLDDMDPVEDLFALAQEAIDFLQGGFTLSVIRPDAEPYVLVKPMSMKPTDAKPYLSLKEAFEPMSKNLVDAKPYLSLKEAFEPMSKNPINTKPYVKETFKPMSMNLVDAAMDSVFKSSADEALRITMRTVEEANTAAMHDYCAQQLLQADNLMLDHSDMESTDDEACERISEFHKQLEQVRNDPDIDEESRAAMIAILLESDMK